jgi:hypothetical protein
MQQKSEFRRICKSDPCTGTGRHLERVVVLLRWYNRRAFECKVRLCKLLPSLEVKEVQGERSKVRRYERGCLAEDVNGNARKRASEVHKGDPPSIVCVSNKSRF